MESKEKDASKGAYKPEEFVEDPDLEAQARALGIAYNKQTQEVMTNPRFDNELTKYEHLLETVGLPKDIKSEDYYTLTEKVQVAFAGWWHKTDSDNYHGAKAKIDEGVKRRVAKGEKKKRIKEINGAVDYFDGLVSKCEETVRKYRGEINGINKKKYVAQAKQAEQDKKYHSIDGQLKKLAEDYQKKQADFDSGNANVDYTELVEAEMQLNAMLSDREQAMSERDHYTNIVESANQKVELRDQAITIASAAKTTHYETLVKLQQKRDKLECDEYDLINVFGKPEKIAFAFQAAKKADVMGAQQDGVLKAAWGVTQNLQGISIDGEGNNGDYTAMAKEAKVKREKASDERLRRSREKSKSLLTSRIETILAEEPSEIFGKKGEGSKKADSEAA